MMSQETYHTKGLCKNCGQGWERNVPVGTPVNSCGDTLCDNCGCDFITGDKIYCWKITDEAQWPWVKKNQ